MDLASQANNITVGDLAVIRAVCRQVDQALTDHDIESMAELYQWAARTHDGRELASQEVLRRAERGMALAIRQAQVDGRVRSHGQRADFVTATKTPTDYAPHSVIGAGEQSIYRLIDGITDEAFDDAMDLCRRARNLSRAQLIKTLHGATPTPRGRPASRTQDNWHYGTRHIDAGRALDKIAAQVDAAGEVAFSLDFADVTVDPETVDTLRTAARRLYDFARKLTTQQKGADQ